MNPIWQVYLHGNAMSDKNAPEPTKRNRKKQAQREKLRQDKEHRRAEAVERDRQRYVVDHEGDKDTDESSNEESAAERFQKELCWCIEQLEKGLHNLKPTAKQAEEATKLLKTLKSPRAPMAKKRQVMRMTFGDYRTKMQREEKKNAATMKKTFLAPATPEKLNKSSFYRKSTSSAVNRKLSSGSGSSSMDLYTVAEIGSSEDSLSSLERNTNDMTLSEEGKPGKNAEGFFVDSEESALLHDLKHCNASCSQADHDNLSLRSSPSGASTSSTASYPSSILQVNQHQHESKQSLGSNDSKDEKGSPRMPSPKNSFCFNFEIKTEDIDHGPPAKKKPGCDQIAKSPKDDSGSSEGGSPKIGDLDKKGPKKVGGRRKKSKKRQEKNEGVVLVDRNVPSQNEKQEISSNGSGEFKFNFPEPNFS